MDYTAQLGRSIMLCTHLVPPVVEKKWSRILFPSYKLRYLNIWDLERIKKEAGLLWAVWHKGIEVNAWRGKGSAHVDQCCSVCLSGTRETILHCLWECPAASKLWRWGMHLMNVVVPREGRKEQAAKQRLPLPPPDLPPEQRPSQETQPQRRLALDLNLNCSPSQEPSLNGGQVLTWISTAPFPRLARLVLPRVQLRFP